MNKGMFYCLPFLALTQVAVSNALPHLEVASLFNKVESTSIKMKTPKPTIAKPISGRNANVSSMIKIFKPRAGRNARLLKSRSLKLIKRR